MFKIDFMAQVAELDSNIPPKATPISQGTKLAIVNRAKSTVVNVGKKV